MDPKRKRLYIILIAICVVVSIVVLLWGRSGSKPTLSDITGLISPSSPSAGGSVGPTKGIDGTYAPPAVFPANNKLDTSVLDSSNLKTAYPFDQTTLGTNDLGRDDPFKSY